MNPILTRIYRPIIFASCLLLITLVLGAEELLDSQETTKLETDKEADNEEAEMSELELLALLDQISQINNQRFMGVIEAAEYIEEDTPNPDHFAEADLLDIEFCEGRRTRIRRAQIQTNLSPCSSDTRIGIGRVRVRGSGSGPGVSFQRGFGSSK